MIHPEDELVPLSKNEFVDLFLFYTSITRIVARSYEVNFALGKGDTGDKW